jgi:hypothetical protein
MKSSGINRTNLIMRGKTPEKQAVFSFARLNRTEPPTG